MTHQCPLAPRLYIIFISHHPAPLLNCKLYMLQLQAIIGAVDQRHNLPSSNNQPELPHIHLHYTHSFFSSLNLHTLTYYII